MATTLHTFMDIFDAEFAGGEVKLSKIVIPMIQRDYAQGRENPEACRVRSRFLDALYQGVAKKPVVLDFVYGDIGKDGVMTPLDGQQRLTTLFLLHWYAAKREQLPYQAYKFLENFSYETRYSARDFCQKLIRDFCPGPGSCIYKGLDSPARQPDGNAGGRQGKRPEGEIGEMQGNLPEGTKGRLSDEIIDQHWFPLDWKCDPTISAMLVMLDDISEKFSSIKNLWERLSGNAISFYFLPIKDMGLTDELYIKMNSRGKPLTMFEHFKAELERELSGMGGDAAKAIGSKIDRAWTDLLWQYRADGHMVDDMFLRYFRFVCDIICYKEEGTTQGKENDAFSLLGCYFSHGNKDAEQHAALLEQYFDCWCDVGQGQDPAGFFQSLVSHGHEQGKICWEKRYEIDLFADCLRNYGETISNGNRAFPLSRTVLLYAAVTYLLHKEEVSKEEFARRLRVVNNLVQNSDFEISDSENRTGGNRMPNILRQVDAIVIHGKIDGGIERNFNTHQLAEESEKLTWAKEHPDLAEPLFALEDHPLLYGQVGIVGLDHPDCFQKFGELFSCSFDAVDCALLATGNYLQQDNDWRYQAGSPMGKAKAWKNLFHKSSSDGFENTKSCLHRLLSSQETFTDNILYGIAEAYINACNEKSRYDWRYYYIKYDCFRPGKYGKIRWEDFAQKPYELAMMWTERYPSTNMYQPFLKAVLGEGQEDILDKGDNGMSLYWGDGVCTVCENDAFVTYQYDEETEEYYELEEERINIAQDKNGIDTEERIEKYKELCWE